MKKAVHKYLAWICCLVIIITMIQFPMTARSATIPEIKVAAPGDAAAVQAALTAPGIPATSAITKLTVSGAELDYSGLKYLSNTLTKLQTLAIPAQIVIPDSPLIGDGAFSGHLSLQEIILPSATSIGKYAFYNCDQLIVLNMPLITSINTYAFGSCDNLKTINLPLAQTIGQQSFSSCMNLTDVILPTATTIQDQAFDSCGRLLNVSLPVATTIGDLAFRFNSNLKQISLPAAITIGSSAFSDCGNLANINLPAATTINDWAFSGCSNIIDLSLPNVATLGISAFSYCGNLLSVNLPLVNTIGPWAFNNCTSLKTYYFGNQDPLTLSVDSTSFNNAPSGASYYYPITSANAASWNSTLPRPPWKLGLLYTPIDGYSLDPVSPATQSIAIGSTGTVSTLLRDDLNNIVAGQNWIQWSIDQIDSRSTIDAFGNLTIDDHETNASLTVTASAIIGNQQLQQSATVNITRQQTLTIDTVANGRSNLQILSPRIYGQGRPVEVWAIPAEGYVFKNWIASGTAVDNSTENPAILSMPNADITLTPVFASTACDLISVTLPESSIVLNENIKAEIAGTVNSQKIDVTVSPNATWEIYSDAACTIPVVPAKTMSGLAVGTNTAYLKILAEDGVISKIFTITLIKDNLPPTPPTGGGWPTTPSIPPIAENNEYVLTQIPSQNNNYTAICNGPFLKLTGVVVDGKMLSQDDYTAWSGSTYVSFLPSFISTLDAGKRTLILNYTDGKAAGDFFVQAESINIEIFPISHNTSNETTLSIVENETVDEGTKEKLI